MESAGSLVSVSIAVESSAFSARSPSEDDGESELRIPAHVLDEAISYAVGAGATTPAFSVSAAGGPDGAVV